MKARILLTIFVFCLPMTPATSDQLSPKVLVIIDTGFNELDPVIASHTVLQVCIMDWYSCPDGSNFQESGTAAMLNQSQLAGKGFDHGSKMARAAIAAYPDVRLILIRMVAQTSNGSRMPTSEAIVTKVLAWSNKNAKTYNIGAVAMSQGSNKIGSNARRCFSSPATDKEIVALKAKGIFTFFPVGNEGRSNSVNWPSCIPDAVAVGALDKLGKIASYSNFAMGQVDLYEPGYALTLTEAPMYSAENGSSFSVQYAAARWLSLVNTFPTVRPSLIYWNFSFSGEPVTNSKGYFGWATDLDSVKDALLNR